MDPLTARLLVIVLSGSAGGIILGMTVRTSHKLRIPFTGRLLEIAFLGDALVGAAASVALFFVTGPLFDLTLTQEMASDQWIKVMALGVLSGLVGMKVLATSSGHVFERISVLDDRMAQLEKGRKTQELIRKAESLAAENRLEHALARYAEALRIDPRNEDALLGQAQILCDRCKWDEAVTTVSKVLAVNPSCERAYYDRACYKNATGKYEKEEILQDLKSAVTLDPLYKTYAALQDNHFQNLRDDERFQSLVQ
ncbi:MAG: tetratricopeptide repeat protein [Phycisphaerae bacterium]